MTVRRCAWLLSWGLLLTVLARQGVAGQVAPPPVAAAAPVVLSDSSRANRVSPRGAFLRALAVPGWGHAAIGSYTRGGFYVAAQATTAYTLLRIRVRLSEARERAGFHENVLRARLASEGITDADAIEQALVDDPQLANVRRLLAAREEQQTDLVALGLFLLLMSGADAYVSAHLSGFPDPLALEVRPSSVGTVDLGIRITIN